MKLSVVRLMRRLLTEEGAQAAVVAIISASVMMALAGASVETGHIYYAYQQLQASTNAAALAGAEAMPDTDQATTNVTLYSSESGKLNANPMLKSVTATPTFVCLNTVSSSLNVPCSTSNGASGGYNALTVKQTAKLNLWFGGMIGVRSMNLAAEATAAMRGGTNTPWNIAIILDTTGSMNGQDSGAQCSGTQITCAKQGIITLLDDLYPCALGATCTSGSSYVDSVSLFVFPALTASTASNDYTCPTSNPTIVAYTFPDPPTSTVLPSGDTYQVIGWSNDYKTSDSASGLTQSSDIVIAAGDSSTAGSGGGGGGYGGRGGRGGGGGSGCNGIAAPGGEQTYYAQVIYAAQTALAAQQTANPGTKDAMIILTDGDATACASNAFTTGGACNSSSNLVATEGKLNGTGTSSSNPGGYNSYAYPSALGECGQAVLAAQTAADDGTAVYSIGYGTETSGCTSDRTYSASVTTNGGSWGPGGNPCKAIAAMASAEVNFYSDDANGCEATAPSNQSITKLTAIFRAITDNLTTPRLIPNGSA